MAAAEQRHDAHTRTGGRTTAHDRCGAPARTRAPRAPLRRTDEQQRRRMRAWRASAWPAGEGSVRATPAWKRKPSGTNAAAGATAAPNDGLILDAVDGAADGRAGAAALQEGPLGTLALVQLTCVCAVPHAARAVRAGGAPGDFLHGSALGINRGVQVISLMTVYLQPVNYAVRDLAGEARVRQAPRGLSALPCHR